MQSAKHWAALGLLGTFGVLIAAGSKKPAERFHSSSIPPVDRQQMAVVASYVVSASDVCVRANTPNPDAMDATSLQAVRDACQRAAEDQAKALEFRDDDWEIVHPGTDEPVAERQKPLGTGRVARRNGSSAPSDSTGARQR
jgi:hypothetical protein